MLISELFEDELAVLRTTVAQCVPNPAITVRLALAALLAGQDRPAHAATVAAIAPGRPAAPMLGAALELMNISLHRLHEGLDRPSREDFCLSMGGDILAGDYLSSVAFRLLVQVDSLPIMGMVSEAIQKACENEIRLLGEATGEQGEQGEYAALAPMIVRRTSTLGGAAGATAALLAGHDECTRDAARRFGHLVAVATHWVKQLRTDTCPEKIALCRIFVKESLAGAEHAAQAYIHCSGNELPLVVCERLRQASLD
jgi:octaprenyl-diphosphate synthase